MKYTERIISAFFITMLAILLTNTAKAQEENWNQIDKRKVLSSDTIHRKKYTLIFINMQPNLDTVLKRRMIDAYFKVYPAEAKTYHKKTIRTVVFVMDPQYKGVAATSNGLVRFNPEWFSKKPNDIDVVTHEVMHIVQGYPNNAGPGWITEGIADYVRYKFGVDNEAAGWKLPDLKPEHHYDNAYRITARFFVWLEEKKKKGLVKKLDKAMRQAKYTEAFWKEQTGLTVEELWKEYVVDPRI